MNRQDQAVSQYQLPLAAWIYGVLGRTKQGATEIQSSAGRTSSGSRRSPGLLAVLSGAVITGAVAGEHLIPYSEKAMMTGIACGIPPLYHVKTMLPQSLAALAAAALGFFLLGSGWGLLAALAIPAAILLAAHLFFARS